MTVYRRDGRPLTFYLIARRLDTFLFSLTLLTSAFLLFSVQPMVGKLLLPRLGGTPGAWNTCMLFFQACLLSGYAYAHLLAVRMKLRTQSIVHVALLLAALFTLPISLAHAGDPPAERNPIPWLLAALLTSAGGAFFVVSTTAPLLQRWYATTGRDPYFLYAASNAGSLLALLAYPVLVEPRLRLTEQARAWTGLYLLLVILTAMCAWRVGRAQPRGTRADAGAAAPAVWRGLRLRWLALSFVPSSYLLGVTTFISSDIAAVPLLWVAPLALYLISFILVFASRPPVPHALVLRLVPPVILVAVVFIMARASQPVWLVLVAHLLAFFVMAVACHGELARLRPTPERLTEFYLTLALGGALGGAFNAIVAPLIFPRPMEYALAIALGCLLATHGRMENATGENSRSPRVQEALDYLLPFVVGVFALFTVKMVPARTIREALPLMLIFFAVPALLCWTFRARPVRFALGVALLLLPTAMLPPAGRQILDVHRSFFGVHRLLRTRDGSFNQLFHGTTMHGAQRVDPATGRPTAPDRPTSYYYPDSPYAQIFRAIGQERRNPRVGVAGLGAGGLAGFAQSGWTMVFFEIDPVVIWAAERSGHFSYLAASRERGAAVETVLGDARQSIARQPDASFDLLALDAFSGDAVPVHLLTREAMVTYLSKLRADGVLVIHISNQYLDLRPVVAALAADAGCFALVRHDPHPPEPAQDEGAIGSRVVVLARSQEPLAPLAADPRWKPLTVPSSTPPGAALWTDDFSNLLETVRWDRPPE